MALIRANSGSGGGSGSGDLQWQEVTIPSSGLTIEAPSDVNAVFMFARTSLGSPYNVNEVHFEGAFDWNMGLWNNMVDSAQYISISGRNITISLRAAAYAGKFWIAYTNIVS